ncbi:MAG: SDR family oxidoreductase [Planctomycetota bacterium]
MTLSPPALLRGRRLLITGASGFLGKVWVAQLLSEVPDVERLLLVVRPGARGARARVEQLLSTSPAFWSLHERHGTDLGAFLAPRLQVLEGDLARPGLGLDPQARGELGRVDAVVHLAGLTTLRPDPREAATANVDGALAALELARELGAAFLHVSTAYVAGRRPGRVAERVEADAPGGEAFDAARELAWWRAREQAWLDASHEALVEAELEGEATAQRRRLGASVAEHGAFLGRVRARWIRERLTDEAHARANRWGWPNAYAQSKAMAEQLVWARRGDVPTCVARPSIVESALSFPFPGWKEGYQTSAPLTYAMSDGPLKHLPANQRLILDAIPVDLVARGLTLCLSALLAGRAPAVVHLGSSDVNPLTVGRAVDLTGLAQRDQRLSWRDLWRADAVPSDPRRYRLTSLPALKALARGAAEALDAAGAALPWPAQGKDALGRWERKARRGARRLGELEEVVDTFLPFVLDVDCVFAADGLRALEAALAPSDRARHALGLEALDWRRYWLDVHLPGLRRWIYPKLAGTRPEKLDARPVSLAAPVEVPRP